MVQHIGSEGSNIIMFTDSWSLTFIDHHIRLATPLTTAIFECNCTLEARDEVVG